MLSRLCVATALAVALAVPAMADSKSTTTSSTRCYGNNCVYTRDYGGGHTSETTCVGPPGRSDCTSVDQQKEPRPTITEVIPYNPGREAEKAERARKEGGYHDPGAVSLCPRPRRMTQDGCQ